MVVLSMITRNSMEKVGGDFARVWESSLQIPYDTIILVDDSDSGATREYVKKFAEAHGKELVVERSRLYGWHKPTRATARQTAIDIFLENTNDEWLFFLDDDFILGEGWWEAASPFTKEADVGLLWGIDYTPYWHDRLVWLKARGISEKEYAIKNFNYRGGLHDTLLRRLAIEGLRLPPWLHVYEDAWVKKFVECKGFRTVVIDVLGNVHLRRGPEGYSRDDEDIMVKVSATLGLERLGIFSFMKALLGLPGYLYFAYKAYGNIRKGFEIWRDRVRFRWKFLLAQKERDPCRVVCASCTKH